VKITVFAVLTAASLITTRGAVFDYTVTLNGANESPVNTSPGIGIGTVQYDDANHSLQLEVAFVGLEGTVTASHIHAATATPFSGTAGVATTTPTFAGFPSGVSLGSYSATLDLTAASSYNPTFVTANGGSTATAEAALASALAGGKAYWNIHSSVFPGGEIRGFAVAVPEPGTLALAGLGVIGFALFAWKNRMNKA
jgi:hypothetical protein